MEELDLRIQDELGQEKADLELRDSLAPCVFHGLQHGPPLKPS